MNSFIGSPSKARNDMFAEGSGSRAVEPASHRGFFGTRSMIKNFSQVRAETVPVETEETYIMGTNLNVKDLKRQILGFYLEFRPVNPNFELETEGTPSYYVEELRHIHDTSSSFLIIQVSHIKEYSKELFLNLVTYPAEVIENFDHTATLLYREKFVGEGLADGFDRNILTTFVGFGSVTPIRDISTDKINRLFAVRGIVIRCSDIYPEMNTAYLACTACRKGSEHVKVKRGQIQEPRKCSTCGTSGSFEIVHNLCTFTDKQHIKLQETPEYVPEGGMPAHINLIVYDDLVDSVKPGDAVEVVGIYRVQTSRISRQLRTLNSVFGTYFDVVSVTSAHDSKVIIHNDMTVDKSSADFSEEETAAFHRFAASNVYEKLLNNFAPSLLDLKDVKKGLLCQLFGGCPKEFASEFKSRFRNELNVLLIGDPSTAKSQLLQFAHKLSSRGIFTSGKGSSAVGLTAYITKDVDTHELILESGALVLSDQGICCIDEFDKMSEDTSSILHEAMEQQTISIAKAGIVCSLNARTGVLAAANPKDSRYNYKRAITYNLCFPPSILSRFDLIYIMLDKVDASNDANLARHLLSLYQPLEFMRPAAKFDEKFLRKYILYARTCCNPRMSEEAGQEAVRGYLEMRRLGSSRNTITATPRQLESVLRISESLARMRLSPLVELSDVAEANRLVREATQAAAFDPITGQVDMGMISTGYSTSMRQRLTKLVEELKRLLNSHESLFKSGYPAADLRKELTFCLKARGEELEELSHEELIRAIKELQEDRHITIVGNERSEHYAVKLLKQSN